MEEKFLLHFGWIADIYMIDHVIEKHWERLPPSWKAHFSALESPQQFLALFEDARLTNPIPPLGLLALKAFVKHGSISRTSKLQSVPKLDNKLRVKIKQKKEHEIIRIIALCENVIKGDDVDEIVDLGAGLGHLSRILSHHLAEGHPERNVVVSTVEGDSQLVESSRELDKRFAKRISNDLAWSSPNREDAYIRSDEQLRREDNTAIKVLLGLHTCGDFSPTIIRYFANHSAARHLIHFGCCYHKLNGGADKLYAQDYGMESHQCTEIGFPMSERYRKVKLSYAARELACHAQEQFVERIRNQKDFSDFKVNCYRAVLEWLIVEKFGYATARHQPVRSVKKAIHFWEYADRALEGAEHMQSQINALTDTEKIEVGMLVNTELKKIFSIYSLRLMAAPFIESIILRDRQEFLKEHGIGAKLEAVFDPLLSPRNIVLFASKNSE